MNEPQERSIVWRPSAAQPKPPKNPFKGQTQNGGQSKKTSEEAAAKSVDYQRWTHDENRWQCPPPPEFKAAVEDLIRKWSFRERKSNIGRRTGREIAIDRQPADEEWFANMQHRIDSIRGFR